MSHSTLLQDYEFELQAALRMRDKEKLTTVGSGAAGKELARGREEIPIEEYITYWEQGVKALKAGADPSQYSY